MSELATGWSAGDDAHEKLSAKARKAARDRERKAAAVFAASNACHREFESLRTAWMLLSRASGSGAATNAAVTLSASQKPVSFVAIDFEFWEHAGNTELKGVPIEIGWAVAELWPSAWPQDVPQTALDGWWFRGAHFCPSDMLSKRNGVYVADNRHRFDFALSSPPFTQTHPDAKLTSIGCEIGELLYPTGTKSASQREIVESFTTMVDRLEAQGPVVFVFHDAHSDIQGLEALGINASRWHKGVPLVSPLPHTSFYVDTRDYSTLLLRLHNLGRGCALKKLAKLLNINGGEVTGLHNAGNDAMYTLRCLVTMLAEGPLWELGDRLVASGALVPVEGGVLKDNFAEDSEGRRSRRGGRGRGGRGRGRGRG